MSSVEHLIDYLLVCFDAGEMRRLLRVLPDGDRLSTQLPGPTASAREVASSVVTILTQTDLLLADEFWDEFVRQRPRRQGDILALKADLQAAKPPPVTTGVRSPAGAGDARPSAPTPGGAPDVLRILLVSASPVAGSKLKVDVEFAKILGELRRCKNLLIEQRTAVTFDRLRQALLDWKPHVLHISSHGTAGFLYFQADAGEGYQQVPAAAVVGLLGLRHDLRLVVFNACESLAIASAVVANKRTRIAWAIGMREPIRDNDAIAYAVSFYDTLAAGQSLAVAHDVGCARLLVNPRDEGTPPAEIPTLVPDDPERADQVILVAER